MLVITYASPVWKFKEYALKAFQPGIARNWTWSFSKCIMHSQVLTLIVRRLRVIREYKIFFKSIIDDTTTKTLLWFFFYWPLLYSTVSIAVVGGEDPLQHRGVIWNFCCLSWDGRHAGMPETVGLSDRSTLIIGGLLVGVFCTSSHFHSQAASRRSRGIKTLSTLGH